MANRLSPQYKPTSSGRNRLVTEEAPKEKSFLKKVGDFFKQRTQKQIDYYGLGKPLTVESAERTATPPSEVGSSKKLAGFALAGNPSNLVNTSAVSKTVDTLKESAVKNYTQALAPTKQKFKDMASKVVPEMIKRRITAFTRSGLHQKTAEGLVAAGDDLERVLSEIPEGSTVSKKPILETINNYQKQFLVKEGSKEVVVNEVGYKNAEKMKELINQFGDDISFGTIRKVRQILDEAVTAGNKAFGRTLDESSAINAKREAANAIRSEIAKEYPNVAIVNAEYTFWKNVDDILEETIQRTKGHGTKIGEDIATVGGAIAGSAGGITNIVTGALAFKWIKQLLNSTGFKTASAITKDKVADLIAQGKFGAAGELIRKTAISIKTNQGN